MNLVRAERCLRESLDLWQKIANPWGIATVLMSLGLVAMHRQAFEEAQDQLHQSLLIWHDLHDRTAMTWNVMRLAELATLRDDTLHAARLWGAAETLRTALGITLPLKWLHLAGMLHKPFPLTALRELIARAVDDSHAGEL